MNIEERIKENLPKKKKDPFAPPYRKIKHESYGDLHYVELGYISEQFEEEASNPEFLDAFKLFYDLKTGKENLEERAKPQPRLYELYIPKFSRQERKIIVKLDIDKEHIQFCYEKDDKETEEIVNDFIKLLMES